MSDIQQPGGGIPTGSGGQEEALKASARLTTANETFKTLATLTGGIADVKKATVHNTEVLETIASYLKEQTEAQRVESKRQLRNEKARESYHAKKGKGGYRPSAASGGLSSQASMLGDIVPGLGVIASGLGSLIDESRKTAQSLKQSALGKRLSKSASASHFLDRKAAPGARSSSADPALEAVRNEDIDEEQVDLLNRLVNNIPSQKDAQILSSMGDTHMSFMDEDAAERLEDSTKGIEQLIGVLDGGAADALLRGGEGVTSFFGAVASIDPAAFENLKNINAFIFKTALGLSMMAGALFLMAQIPAVPALAGIGVMTLAVAALALMGIPPVAAAISLGAGVLPLAGLALLAFAAPVVLAFHLLAGAEDGVDAFHSFIGALGTMADMDWKALMLSTAILGVLPPIIAANAFALRLMPGKGTEAFAQYIETLSNLAGIEGLGASLRDAAVGIAAVRLAMIGSGIGGMVDNLAGAGQLAGDLIRNMAGLDAVDRNPFRFFIELAAVPNVGAGLKGAAEGIIAVRAAMFGQQAVNMLENLAGAGRLVGDIFRSLTGMEEADRNPFRYYIELAAVGMQLSAAGTGIAAMAEGFERLQDIKASSLREVGSAIGDFIDAIGLEKLTALGAALLTIPQLMSEGSSPFTISEESVNDAIVRSDGSVVHLNPEDNIYATVNDLQVSPIGMFGGEGATDGSLQDVLDELSAQMQNSSEDMRSLVSSLRELVVTIARRESRDEGTGVSQSIIVNNKGYNTQELLAPTVMGF